MTYIGYQASHEQFNPKTLLALAKEAEHAGFHTVLSSDHLAPWSQSQGDSGFAWTWIGSALEGTGLNVGVVTVAGYRYHPVILAQAVGTLQSMYPQRFFLTMGSGEALNEYQVTGVWPEKEIRNQIFRESVEIMRRLWRGEEVTHVGFNKYQNAKLYLQLSEIPKIYGAALTEQTAEFVGSFCDGMITTSRPLEELRKMKDAFVRGGGEGKPLILKAQISYAKTIDEALEGAYNQWKYVSVTPELLGNLRTPDDFERESDLLTKEDIKKNVKLATDISEIKDWLSEMEEFSFERIILHNVHLNQKIFLQESKKLFI